MRFLKFNISGQNILVSKLGFGCARLFSGIELRHAAGMLERAYELGIRHYDTAPSYGHGQSENIIGEVFAGVDHITLTTKVGLPRPTGAASFVSVARRLTLRRLFSYAPTLKKKLLERRQGGAISIVSERKRVLERDVVLRSLDDSLKRLRRDHVDFYCVHEPDQYLIDHDLVTIFDNLKASGVISAHGLAWNRAESTAAAGWDFIQAAYSSSYPRDKRPRFFHGILRTAQSNAPARLASAMRTELDAAFIVSASEKHQLAELVEKSTTEPASGDHFDN